MPISKFYKLIFIVLLLISPASWALDYPVADKSKLITEQTELLKNRLLQAKNEVSNLEHEQENQWLSVLPHQTSKQIRNQMELDIAVAKSNLDSVNVELSESQQSISRLEKDIQEIENQLNVVSIFGIKIIHNEHPNISGMKAELNYQQNLLQLEKARADYFFALQNLSETTLQLRKEKYARVNLLLKSQSMMRLKAQQVKSELDFQQQQSFWLQRLNTLYSQVSQLNPADKNAYNQLQAEIFYANENVNLTYLQMLIGRYQDQLHQLKISISHTGSISLLNKANEEVQALAKQLVRVKTLLNTRIKILERRKVFLLQHGENEVELVKHARLMGQYQTAIATLDRLSKQVILFRVTLNQVLEYEISSRQGLPGFSAKAWRDLGEEMSLVPALGFQVVKSLFYTSLKVTQHISYLKGIALAALELSWLVVILVLYQAIKKRIAVMALEEDGHVNLKRVLVQVLQRNWIDIAIIINVIGLLAFFKIPPQNSSFLVNIALVWLFFKSFLTTARLCLVETVHDRAGQDVRLYHRLKWTCVVGAIITALTVFLHSLPIVYEVQDLFERLFLLFLVVISIFLLRSWDVLPHLILPHIDERRLYLKKVVLMLGLLMPLVVLINSVVGLFGFINLVITIAWYEGVFLLLLVGYLVLRGLLIDSMMFLSMLLIRHVTNGWLWTEAFLKPLDKVLHIALFLSAWVALFLCYGWDQQSPVVERLDKLLHYHLGTVLNTIITPTSILELVVVVSLLFWVARWSREFVYRLLSARTEDLGLRNSLAIFSQYAMVVMGVLIGLRVLGIDFKALGVVVGAFAIGLSFGLRDLANNFACGILLLIERPLRVGDTVEIGVYEGEVTHVGARAVTVRTWDHMEVLVPNAEIFSKSFTNWTAKDHIVRTVIAIKISRQDNPHDVQSIILDTLAEHPLVLRDPMPEALLKELSDGLIEFEVRYYINLRQVKSRVAVRSDVLLAIWNAFDKYGIQPPYPQHEIHVQTQTAIPALAALPLS